MPQVQTVSVFSFQDSQNVTYNVTGIELIPFVCRS